MRIIVVILLLFTLPSIVSGQKPCAIDKIDLLKKSLDEYIDSVRKDNVGDKIFDIPVANFYYLDSNKTDFSFTLEYIINSYELNRRETPYFFKHKGNYILVSVPDKQYVKKFLPKLDLRDVQEEAIEIAQHLYPRNVGCIFSHPPRMAISVKDCKVVKKYYDSFDEGWSIYPPDTTSELVSQYARFKESILKEISGCWKPYDYSEFQTYWESGFKIKSKLSKEICIQKDSLTVFEDSFSVQGYKFEKINTEQYLHKEFGITKEQFGVASDNIYTVMALCRSTSNIFSIVDLLYDGKYLFIFQDKVTYRLIRK